MIPTFKIKLETDFNNPKWIERHRFMFDFLDINKNGKITLDDIMKRTNNDICLLYTSPSPRDKRQSRMPSSA